MRAFPALALAALAVVASQAVASMPITFSAPTHLGDAMLGAEPGLVVAPDGTVYMGTPGDLARSDDAGNTWAGVGKTYCLGLTTRQPGGLCPFSSTDPGMIGAGDTSLAVGADGTLYHLGLGGSAGSIPFQRSTDKGANLSPGIDLADAHSTDRQWLIVGPDGALHASWRDLTLGKVAVRNSVDGGVTWGPIIPAVNDGHEGPIAADPNGTALYLPHVQAGKVLVAKSTDGGNTWVNNVAGPVFEDTFDFPIVAVDAAHTVYVVWNHDPTLYGRATTISLVDRPISVPQVFLAVSKDGGVTWSAPQRISPAGTPSMFPWIVAGAAGKIGVTWYEGLQKTPSDRTPNVWHVAVSISTNADTATPQFQETFVDANPNHIGGICTEGLLCNLSAADRSLLDFYMIGIVPDGSIVVTYAGDSTAYQGYTSVFAARMTSGPSLR